MIDIRRALVICAHELNRAWRSMFLVGMTLGAPLAVCAVIYFAFAATGDDSAEQQPETTSMAFWFEAPDPILEQALGPMAESGWTTVRTVQSREQARALVLAEEVEVAVLVMADRSIEVLHDPVAQVAPVITTAILRQIRDAEQGAKSAAAFVAARAPDDAAPAEVAEAYGKFMGARAQRADAMWPGLTVSAPAGQKGDSSSEFMALLMAKILAAQLVFFAFFAGGYGAQSLLRDEEEGTLRRLRTFPLTTATVLMGKSLFVAVLVGLQTATLMLVGGALFGVHWGTAPRAGLAALGLLPVTAGFGIFVMSFVTSTRQAGPVMGGLFTMMGALGGLFTVAIPNLPPAMDIVALFTPHGWAFRSFNLALAGAPLSEVALGAAVCFGLGAVFFLFGVVRTARRMG